MKMCFCALLAALAVLLVPAITMAQTQDLSHLSDDPEVVHARLLVLNDRFDTALEVLRRIELSDSNRIDVLFLAGLATMGAAEERESAADREALLDEAIAALRAILVERPDLVRVRLELARAFFLRGEDELASEHFERVLAGGLHPVAVANVRRFLNQIRERRRWRGNFGFSVAPDSNIGAASDSDIIYIFGLPFQREGAETARSGVGLSIWSGAEYQYPLAERMRLRMGVDASRQEYEGGRFDSTSLSTHLGPRWLIDRDTEASLLATAERRWATGSTTSRAQGARLEFRRRMSQRVTARGRLSWKDLSNYGGSSRNGPVTSLSLGGDWNVSSVTRLYGDIGYDKERTAAEVWRNHTRSIRTGFSVDLPQGYTVGGSGQLRWTDFRGNWGIYTPGGTTRSDRTRTLRVSTHNRGLEWFGFSPELALVNEARKTNAQLYDFRRNRLEIGFQRQF